jgi:hypothetical protein
MRGMDVPSSGTRKAKNKHQIQADLSSVDIVA